MKVIIYLLFLTWCSQSIARPCQTNQLKKNHLLHLPVEKASEVLLSTSVTQSSEKVFKTPEAKVVKQYGQSNCEIDRVYMRRTIFGFQKSKACYEIAVKWKPESNGGCLIEVEYPQLNEKAQAHLYLPKQNF